MNVNNILKKTYNLKKKKKLLIVLSQNTKENIIQTKGDLSSISRKDEQNY